SRPGEVEAAVMEAINLGYRHIDTAFFYQNEKEIGQAVQAKIKDGTVKREDLFITTKLWNNFHKQSSVVPTCKKSLENLGLSYLDLYLVHWPFAFQVEVNINVNQTPLIEFCKKHNITITGYSPLGQPGNKAGIPTGLDNPVVIELSKKHNKTPAQIILRYVLQQGIAIIPKTVTSSRLKENMNIFDFSLTNDEMASIDKIGTGQRVARFGEWNSKLSNRTNSPACNRLLSLDNIVSPITQCGSWRSRMLDKVKEYRDAIKNMMTFDKTANGFQTARINDKRSSNSSIDMRATTSLSSIPDVVTFSSIALKYKEYEDIPIAMRGPRLNTTESRKLNAPVEPSNQINNTSDSPSRFASMDNMISSSLKSFLALEKQVKEEFLEEDDTFTIKKKISAEPFLSYTEGIAEFVWTDDSTEESLHGKLSNSLEHLNSEDISFGDP
ncbi:unnamed protein product, partial [Heterotrigona itama]